jgi:predicted NAD/FAD-binding protein
VTVYEAASHAGGHSNTVDITLDGTTYPVDTGFLVHNDRTYPNLIQLMPLLGVETPSSDMSFSVKLPRENLEWAGSTLASLFVQPANLVRPGFWRMLRDIMDFNSRAGELLGMSRRLNYTLGELLDAEDFSREFMDWYLLPMGAAIWSSPLQNMRAFPAETFIQFCLNHGLLQIFNRPQWKTILGGSREYVRAMCDRIGDVRLNAAVLGVRRDRDAVVVTTLSGEERYDRVILAAHTDQSLALLKDASTAEIAVLGSIAYQPNTAWLHTDTSLMPRRRGAWAAWNYYADDSAEKAGPVAVNYWLNKLQPLPFTTDVFVTLNPPKPPAASTVLKRIEYSHPLLDQLAYKAQQQLDAVQGLDRVYFCGAWSGYGFHEDGLKSGMRVAKLLGASIPWEASL